MRQATGHKGGDCQSVILSIWSIFPKFQYLSHHRTKTGHLHAIKILSFQSASLSLAYWDERVFIVFHPKTNKLEKQTSASFFILSSRFCSTNCLALMIKIKATQITMIITWICQLKLPQIFFFRYSMFSSMLFCVSVNLKRNSGQTKGG